MNDNTTVIEILAQVKDATQSGVDSATKNVSKLEQSMAKMQSGIEKTQKMSKIEIAATLTDKVSSGLNTIMDKAKGLAGKVWNVTLKAVDLVTAPIRGIMGLLTNPIFAAAGFAGISLGAADTLNTFKDFESQMANIKAITGASDEEMSAMESGIRSVAKGSNQSVIEIAQNAKMLAEAGGDVNLMMSQLTQGTNLATATQSDMATTLDFLGSSMKTFGLDTDSTQAVVDSMAYTTRMANVTLSDLADSYA